MSRRNVDLPLPAGNYAKVDHNLCYFPRAPGKWERGGRPMGPHDVKLASGTPLSAILNEAPRDLAPAVGSPLIGRADPASDCLVGGKTHQPCTSARAIGTAEWSATDPGKVRDAAPDIGAFEH